MKRIINSKYVVYIGSTNYLKSLGGVEKIIYSQQNDLKENGISMIYIYPLMLIDNRPKTVLNCWGCIIDGEYQGVVSTHRVLKYIKSMREKKKLCSVFIHHLLNSNFREVDKLLAVSDVQINLYFHDCFLLCRNFNLMKNDEEFCGYSPVSDEKCLKCIYYKKTIVHKKRVLNLLQTYKKRLTIIFPSDSSYLLFKSFYPSLDIKYEIIYHQQLRGEYKGNRKLLDNSQDIKVAFVGYKSLIKGWYDWKDIVEHLPNESGLELFQFGKTDESIPNVVNIEIDYKDNDSAMVDKLREYKIDCAILWSCVPETYSYTYYECLAANVFVITRKNSGNIEYQVSSRKNGIVLESKIDLFDILSNKDQLLEMINQFKAQNIYSPNSLIQEKSYLKSINNNYETNITPDNIKVNIYDYIGELVYALKEKKGNK